MVIIECGYSAFSSIEGKSDFLNEMAENDLAEVGAICARICVLYTVSCFQMY